MVITKAWSSTDLDWRRKQKKNNSYSQKFRIYCLTAMSFLLATFTPIFIDFKIVLQIVIMIDITYFTVESPHELAMFMIITNICLPLK